MVIIKLLINKIIFICYVMLCYEINQVKSNVQENDEDSDLDLIPRKKPSGNDNEDSDLDTVPRKRSIKKEKDDSDNSPGLLMQK